MPFPAVLSTQLVQLTPMDLLQSKRDLLLSLTSNIATQASSLTNVTNETQVLLNDLDTRLKAIGAASDLDIDAVNATLKAITDLQSDGSIGATIIGTLGTIYSELNSRETSNTFEEVITASNGTVDVDLTQFGFASTNDYNIQVSGQGFSPVTPTYQKVTNNLVKIFVRDHEHWEFDEKGTANLKDCSTENVTVSITVSRLPSPITATFTEVDGDVTIIGPGSGTTSGSTGNSEPVVEVPPVTAGISDVDGLITASGFGVIGSNVQINVTFPDGTSVTQIARDFDGRFIIPSAAAVTVDGNVTISQTVGGVTSVSRVYAYTAPATGGNAL